MFSCESCILRGRMTHQFGGSRVTAPRTWTSLVKPDEEPSKALGMFELGSGSCLIASHGGTSYMEGAHALPSTIVGYRELAHVKSPEPKRRSTTLHGLPRCRRGIPHVERIKYRCFSSPKCNTSLRMLVCAAGPAGQLPYSCSEGSLQVKAAACHPGAVRRNQIGGAHPFEATPDLGIGVRTYK